MTCAIRNSWKFSILLCGVPGKTIYCESIYYGVCVRVSVFLKLSSWANTGVLTGVHFSFMGAVVILFVSQIYQSYIKMRDVNELYYFDGFVDE